MMPSALALGAGGEFRAPMALAVIGGLIFSTILSLVFVPAMFMLMDDLGTLFWRYAQRLLVSHGESEAKVETVERKGPATVAPSPAAE
jgi:AcrB/AcrD/AcrF family